jgi:hypothetical protein
MKRIKQGADMDHKGRILRLGVALAMMGTVTVACAQNPPPPPPPPPPVLGWIPCPHGGNADFTISIVDGEIRVSPNDGDGRIKTNGVVRWFGATDFQLRLHLDRQEQDAEPAPVPADWTAPKDRHCYRAGKGPYELKYDVKVGTVTLDPRIIIDR